MNKLAALSLIFYSLLCLTACEVERDNDWSAATDNSIIQDAFEDLFKQADALGQTNAAPNNSCLSLSFDSAMGVYPDTVIMDFNGLCSDGRLRQGRVIAYFSGPWRSPGTELILQTQGYSLNGNEIIGRKRLVNTTPIGSNNFSYEVFVQDAKIIFVGGDTASWSSARTVQQVAGQGTNFASDGWAGLLDDVYEITGTASGISRTGRVYSANITTPLIRRADCRWLVAGIIEVLPQGGLMRTIDFGNQDCDNQVFLSFRRRTVIVNLP